MWMCCWVKSVFIQGQRLPLAMVELMGESGHKCLDRQKYLLLAERTDSTARVASIHRGVDRRASGVITHSAPNRNGWCKERLSWKGETRNRMKGHTQNFNSAQRPNCWLPSLCTVPTSSITTTALVCFQFLKINILLSTTGPLNMPFFWPTLQPLAQGTPSLSSDISSVVFFPDKPALISLDQVNCPLSYTHKTIYFPSAISTMAEILNALWRQKPNPNFGFYLY